LPSAAGKRSLLCLINSKAGPLSIGRFLYHGESGITAIDEPVIPNLHFVHSQPLYDPLIMTPSIFHTMCGLPHVVLGSCALFGRAGNPRFSPASSTYYL
jgi:hypothetical protein